MKVNNPNITSETVLSLYREKTKGKDYQQCTNFGRLIKLNCKIPSTLTIAEYIKLSPSKLMKIYKEIKQSKVY